MISGGILAYVKSSIPSRRLSFELCISIQAISFEINLRKEKWLVISIYRPPLQNSEYFLNSLTKIIDYFASTYGNHLILGDFNLEPTDFALVGFLDSNSLNNLIKTNTCFKSKVLAYIWFYLTGNFHLSLLQHIKRNVLLR